jgi:hypothetical protein
LRLLGICGRPVSRGSRPRRYYPVPDIDEVNAATDFGLFHPDDWDLTVHRIVGILYNFSWSNLEVDDDSDLRTVWEGHSRRKSRPVSGSQLGREQVRGLSDVAIGVDDARSSDTFTHLQLLPVGTARCGQLRRRRASEPSVL